MRQSLGTPKNPSLVHLKGAEVVVGLAVVVVTVGADLVVVVGALVVETVHPDKPAVVQYFREAEYWRPDGHDMLYEFAENKFLY